MPIEVAAAIVAVVQVHLALGLAFACWFAARGAVRLVPAARRGTLAFRFLLVPGAALLWPLLLVRTLRAGGTR